MWPDAVPVLRDWVILDVLSPTDQWWQSRYKGVDSSVCWTAAMGGQSVQASSVFVFCHAPVDRHAPVGTVYPRAEIRWFQPHTPACRWSKGAVLVACCSLVNVWSLLTAGTGKVRCLALQACWVIYGPSWVTQAQQRPDWTHGLCRSVGDCHRVAVGLHICSRRLEWLHYICHCEFFPKCVLWAGV